MAVNERMHSQALKEFHPKADSSCGPVFSSPSSLKTSSVTAPLLSSQEKPKTVPEISPILIKRFVAKGSTQEKKAERLQTAEEFVGATWSMFKLPPCCGSETGKNAEFLANKLSKILEEPELNNKLKEKICQKVIDNFIETLNETTGRVQTDLKDMNFRNTFDIQKRSCCFINCSVTSITPLGEETHNRGRIPFLVTFSDGKKVVYKPRPMKVEQMICGNEGSIFSEFEKDGLGTYAVYNNKTQNYGYSEYIESNGSELTIEPRKNTSSLKSYSDRFTLVDQISRHLGLSDLHAQNIITRNGAPLLIDAEVAMVPTDTDAFRQIGTCLLTGRSAGYKFYFLEGINPGTKIAIKKQQSDDYFCDEEALDHLNQAIESSHSASLPLNPNSRQYRAIENVKSELAKENHRIVLVHTEILSKSIQMPPEVGMANFQRELLSGAEAWGFEITASQATLNELFISDMENHDVPVFYQNPSSGNLYYNGQVIGRRHPYPSPTCMAAYPK